MELKEKANLVLLAGGQGRRLGAGIPKQCLEVGGKPLMRFALEPFLNHPLFKKKIVVCDPKYQSLFDDLKNNVDVSFAPPGKERQQSLYHGLLALKEDNSMVFVHDAARPFVDPKYFNLLYQEALLHGAAVLAIPAVSTLKHLSEHFLISKALDRSSIWEMQTPQVTTKIKLLQALEMSEKNGVQVTDEASLMELIGCAVKVVRGDSLNLKVTTPEDLKLAQALAKYHLA